MRNLIIQSIKDLPEIAQEKLKERAKKAGMTVPEFIQYTQHVSIYRNAEEVLKLKQKAA